MFITECALYSHSMLQSLSWLTGIFTVEVNPASKERHIVQFCFKFVLIRNLPNKTNVKYLSGEEFPINKMLNPLEYISLKTKRCYEIFETYIWLTAKHSSSQYNEDIAK